MSQTLWDKIFLVSSAVQQMSVYATNRYIESIKGVVQANIELWYINFIYCWLQAIKLWLYSNSYLRSCLFNKNWPIKRTVASMNLSNLPRQLHIGHLYKLSLQPNKVLQIFWLVNGIVLIDFMCWLPALFSNFLFLLNF